MAADEARPRAIVDFFNPKTLGLRDKLTDVVDADQSRRFHEPWSKRTYLIKDTVVITGDEALKLFGSIKFGTDDSTPGTGWSGHNPECAVTFFFGDKKSFVTTFCFESASWIRRESGKPVRAKITKPVELKELLTSLGKPVPKQGGTDQPAATPELEGKKTTRP